MTNPVPMEFEVVIDHFYVFDNVGVFPFKTAIDFFPNFIQKIYNTGYDLTNNHRIVFAAVSSDNLITPNIFDGLPLHGAAIYNMNSKAIDYFKVENESYLIKTRILDIITRSIHVEIFFRYSG